MDIHRHHDAKPLNDPHFGEVELAQGITTAVAGNCGISMTPRPESDEAAKEYYSFEEAVMGPIGLDGPHTSRDYLAAAPAPSRSASRALPTLPTPSRSWTTPVL